MGIKSILVRRASFGEQTGELDILAGLAVRAWSVIAKQALGHSAGQPVGPELVSETLLNDVELSFREMIAERHESPLASTLVAVRDQQICGWGARIAQSNYISDIWVDPVFHRQGIGHVLMDALMAEILLSGFSEALIGTHADNHPAIALYQRCGFAVIAHETEFSQSFGRNVEKLRMRAVL